MRRSSPRGLGQGSRRALAAGLAIALAYVAAAAVSGRLSPLARRPILDGFTTPPPYRWVKPPPDLAATNQEPTPGSFTVRMGAGGSAPGVFTTSDAQASLVLQRGAIPPQEGVTSVTVAITPLDPTTFPAPSGYSLQGNVVRITARGEPSGKRIVDLAVPAQVALVYPAMLNAHIDHTLLYTPDGSRWQALESLDSAAQLQVVGSGINGFGSYAASVKTSGPVKKTGGSRSLLILLIVIGALGLAAFIAILRVNESRRSRDRGTSPPEDGGRRGRRKDPFWDDR